MIFERKEKVQPLKINTTFDSVDSLMIGLEGSVQVEFEEPVFEDKAWKVVYRLTGSDKTYERYTYGATPLQALFLAVKLLRALYEPDLAADLT